MVCWPDQEGKEEGKRWTPKHSDILRPNVTLDFELGKSKPGGSTTDCETTPLLNAKIKCQKKSVSKTQDI
eukprot:12482249-Ditylum_brightwellii.AAC.1